MNIITAIYKKLFKTRVNERKLKTQYFEKSITEFYLAVWVEECSNMLTYFLYKINIASYSRKQANAFSSISHI